MSDDDKDRAQFMVLAKRYVELGRLLPPLDAIGTEEGAVATVQVVAAEMHLVRSEIDALFDRVNARHNKTINPGSRPGLLDCSH